MRRRLLMTLAVWLVGAGALRVSFLAPEHCPGREPGDALDAARAAGAWITAGQQRDGRFLYEYDRRSDELRPGYNLVRHAGVTMSLYQLVTAGDEDVLDAADAGLEFMLDRVEPTGTGLALVEPGSGSARAGASALLTAALLDRRAATGEDRYDEQLRGLGEHLAGQVGPDGAVSASYDLGSRTASTETSRYATGEVGWALARLGTAFPGEGWELPAHRVAGYLATRRDEAEGMDFRPWPDQWAAYLLAELGPQGLTVGEATYARALAARFGLLVRVESQKDGWPTPFVDAHARGAGLGVWVEGLGSLARLADVEPALHDLAPLLDERLACGAGILAARQVRGGSTREVGAWFRDGITRMDDQQHSLSALLAAAGLFGTAAA